MKRICLAAVLLLLAAMGCKKEDTTTYTAPDGSQTTISKSGETMSASDGKGNSLEVNGKTATVKDDKGNTTTLGQGTVSEADLGVPFYPGSEEKAGLSAVQDGPNGK